VTPFAGALALAGVATAANGGISPVTPVSPNGHRISDAYWLILGITGAIFLLVEGTLLAFVIRYRRRGRPRTAEPPQIHGATRVEIVWTVVPVLILAVIVSFVFYKLPGIKNTPPATAAGNRMNVKVEAHQFYWLFKYPDGREAINVLTVPRGRVVTLDVTTADVAHSWWVPAFGGKIDAIPGTTNHTWFKAEKAGTYPIRCAEFCGIQHAAMLAYVQVLPADKYDAWVQRRKTQPTEVGRETFLGSCAKCHGLAGQGDIGPAIAQSPILADRDALRTLLRHGGIKMPAVGKTWGEGQMNATIDYLRTRFKAGGGSGG
jgi:cytochrome c oxidase subunit 2